MKAISRIKVTICLKNNHFYTKLKALTPIPVKLKAQQNFQIAFWISTPDTAISGPFFIETPNNITSIKRNLSKTATTTLLNNSIEKDTKLNFGLI